MALRVIGAGLGRTGTMSLRDALNQLGFGPCYHMLEIIRNPGYARHWARLAQGRPVDWEEVFAGYQASVDWPACSYWRELAGHYPDAKLILTVRDPEQWFASTQRTIFSDGHLEPFFAPGADPDWRLMIERLYGVTFHDRGQQREHAIAVFKAHNADVQRSVPRDRLLVFDVAQGWEPLCRFLGVPVPELPFPRVNTTEDWLQRPRRAPRQGC